MSLPANKPHILALVGCYWPGNEATGPSQSFHAFASALCNEFNIRVVAETGPGQIQRGWTNDDVAPRALLPVGPGGARGLRRLLQETPHDLLMLAGFHDRAFTIPALLHHRFSRGKRSPVILSPRGELAPGALEQKAARKRVYRTLARQLGLTTDIWFHATAAHEHEDIEASGLACRGILDAPNFRTLSPPLPQQPAHGGPLRLIFLGRITPIKNLHLALDVLTEVAVPVQFDIFGPIADSAYWTTCEKKIEDMPNHVTVRYRGTLVHADVAKTMTGYDLFFMPTKGENFGHAINEALAAGLPALIADTTPWRGLEAAQAGWDLPLNSVRPFVQAIETLAAQNPATRDCGRRAARAFAERSFTQSDAFEANRRMIETVLAFESTRQNA